MNFPTTPLSATPIRRKLTKPTETPDCFTKVTVETPLPAKRRTSKYDEVRNLKVAVRVRPMNEKELACMSTLNVISFCNENELTVTSAPPGNSNIDLKHTFQYDHVFNSTDEDSVNYTSQEDVFRLIGDPLIKSTFLGYNACLFAYGQTGSGKSYSMMGTFESTKPVLASTTGIIPRFCYHLFDEISKLGPEFKVNVEVSYFEIYNEKIHDLLLETRSNNNNKKVALKVREHPVWGPYVVDLSVHKVTSFEDVCKWLSVGNKNRASAATVMNEKSSRSHSIFNIEVSMFNDKDPDGQGRRSKVSLVDLAGSERLGQHNGNNDERIRQGVSINKSLLTLGKVISALADQKRGTTHIPYRESILTWLLRESLGGNSLTSMLATISPASCHIEETLATLRYACQAKSIINRARINEDPHDRLIRELRSEVERLRALRKSYERHSLSVVSNESSKLDITREQWEKEYLETKNKQMQELEQVEEKKLAMESKIRVLSMVDTNKIVSPYKSNYLEELENILEAKDRNEEIMQKITSLLKLSETWCRNRTLHFKFSFDSEDNICIENLENGSRAVCSVFFLEELIVKEEPKALLTKLKWTYKKTENELNETRKHFDDIYKSAEALSKLIDEDDTDLQNIQIQFLESLNTYENAFSKRLCQ